MSGIGFGSTEEGYALYISPTLSTGHSYPSLTFNNSQLSSSTHFKI